MSLLKPRADIAASTDWRIRLLVMSSTAPSLLIQLYVEVYALSWIVAGTVSGSSIPKNAAWYVVQRGVGRVRDIIIKCTPSSGWGGKATMPCAIHCPRAVAAIPVSFPGDSPSLFNAPHVWTDRSRTRR